VQRKMSSHALATNGTDKASVTLTDNARPAILRQIPNRYDDADVVYDARGLGLGHHALRQQFNRGRRLGREDT